jgi:membrane-associated phospholipid phosphatase
LQLFYLINGWAGRSVWLDAALRFFYVGALPLLATALAALIFLWPQREGVSAPFVRRRLFAATLLSLAFGVLVAIAINAFQVAALGGSPLSARPFMTHRVNLLLVEPNGNSFPCFETLFAASAATLIWAAIPRAGVLAWCFVLLLGFARTYCGSNYVGDSVAGMALGAAMSTLSLALCRVRLRLPSLQAGAAPRWQWRLRHQGAVSGAMLLALFFCAGWWLWSAPAHATRVRAFISGGSLLQNTASAAPTTAATRTDVLHDNIRESESGEPANDATPDSPGKLLLDSRVTRLDGYLPHSEEYLKRVFAALHLPRRVIGVNVAQVRAGTSNYRCAAIRFEVVKSSAGERQVAAQVAAELVKRAFQADAQLQHVDVLGIWLRGATNTTPNAMRPIFTASIERRDLIIRQPGKPRWVNDPHLEGGLWLRARSLLFIDPKVLPPAAPESTRAVAPQIVHPPTIKKPVTKKSVVQKPAVKKPIAKSVAKPITRQKAATRRVYRTHRKTRRYRTRRHHRFRRH